jgi:Tol biopolymer transport system component
MAFLGRFSVFAVVVAAICVPVYAQDGAYGVVYRPDSVVYRVGQSAHFEYIYQTGSGDMARRTARALEATWPGTDSLVWPSGEMDMPVVINDFNDRSNGFVNPLPFRQEIEAPSIKSPPLVARAPSWPAIVAPHEAVHAAHAEVDGTVGVGSLIRPFAPDLARSLNLLAPRGLIEGVAVYRESRLDDRTGRLNAPRFRMKMEAAMLSDDPWSLTQMLEPPAYTQPFNRFYVGGSHAFEYLAERGDSTDTGFFDTAVTWHNRLPVFGHGVWMGLSLGQFPHQIGDDVQSSLRAQYRDALDARAPFTSTTVVSGESGRTHRRPYWLDDGTLLAYVHGYDVRPGFYRIDATTGARSAIRIQELTEDRVYSLGPDTTSLYAGRYVQAPLVPRQEVAEIERVDLTRGTATRLTRGGRAFAPAATEEGVYAITNDGPFTRWSAVEDGRTTPLTTGRPRSLRQIAPAPDDSTIAVLVHEEGRQRVYRTQEPVERPVELEPWFGFGDAVVYDLSWGPEGRYLLFSADLRGPPNAFAFDTQTREVLRLTDVRYGALEPALSPDRSTLAFVNYRHERYDLVRTPFRPDSVSSVPDSLIRRGDWTVPARSTPDSTGAFSPDGSYAAWRHLAPRMVYPTVHGGADGESVPSAENPARDPLGLGLGLGVQGSDPLQRWAYRGNAYWQDGRFWGEARVQTGTFLLRPSVSLYDRAFTTFVRDNAGRDRVKVEERGAALGVRLPVTLESNVYQSQFRLGMDAELRQTRLFGSSLSRPTAFATRATLEPQAVFGYRLQQNPRDLVPNTGTVVGIQAELDAWTDGQRPGSQGVAARVDTYLPVLREHHTGIRLGARALLQNRGAIFNTETFVPRGYSTVTRLPSGPFLELEAEVTQPLWYIDDGLTLLPFYAKALSVYGFGETLGRVEGGRWQRALSSVGAGVSLTARVFYGFNLDLRLGAAYRPERGDVVGVYR